MNIEQLEYILAIDKYGSMRVAGEKLHVSQQGISAAIKNLEAEVGTMLVNRTSKGSSLTIAGRGVAHFADTTLTNWNALVDEIHNSKQRIGAVKEICIITSSMLGIAKLENYLHDYLPNVKTKISFTSNPIEVVDIISKAQNGIGFIICAKETLINMPDSVHFHVVEEFHASVNASYRNSLARVDPFSLDALEGQTIFVPFEKSSSKVNQLQALIDRYNLEEKNSVIYGSSPVFFNDLIRADAGVSLQMIGNAPINDVHPDIAHLIDCSETFYYTIVSSHKDLLSLAVNLLE